MAVPAIIYVHPWDVRRRLTELGVSLEALVAAVRAGHGARILCTENDAPFIPGTEAWRFVLRTLREELLPLGWRKDDPGNYSLVINDNRKINVVVESGDASTGIEMGHPKARALKGLYTEAAVARNIVGQEDLFPETIPLEVKQKAFMLTYPTWILLVYITDDTIRAELSYPNGMLAGEITSWQERIILPHEEIDPGVMKEPPADEDQGPDFDITVSRKG